MKKMVTREELKEAVLRPIYEIGCISAHFDFNEEELLKLCVEFLEDKFGLSN